MLELKKLIRKPDWHLPKAPTSPSVAVKDPKTVPTPVCGWA